MRQPKIDLRCGAVPRDLYVAVEADAAIEFRAADGDGQQKLRRFAGVAYTGGAMRPMGYYRPVVIDLGGLKVAAGSRPILLGHNAAEIVGHTETVQVAGSIRVDGVISGASEAARQVVEAGDNGFPWRMSVGASVERMILVDEGESVEVNGRRFTGPLLVARKATLMEISFVPLAADNATSARVAAAAAQTIEVQPMKFDTWLKARGYDPDTLDDAKRAELKSEFDADQAKPPKGAVAANPPTPPADPPADPIRAAAGADVAEYRRRQAEETQRIAKIREVCAGRHAEIEAKAIAEGWPAVQAEVEVLRADRPTGPAIHGGGPAPDREVLVAAVRMSGGDSDLLVAEAHKPEVMDRAYTLRRIGLKGLIAAACQLDGRPVPAIHAGDADWIRAGFSTTSLAGILGDSANKSLMAAYRSVDSVARVIAKKLTVNNFLTHTGYRLTGDPTLLQVGEDGELKHMKLGESSFTYRVETYGRIFGITRQMMVNDDLGAFMEVPRRIGRGAALALEKAFWTLVLANTGNFFHANNSNLITAVLASAGLGTAVQTFRKLVDADGNPIAVMPRYLVVPPELEVTADELYASTNVNTGGASTAAKQPNKNIFAGKYEPKVSPYISNASFTGQSATQWMLFGDPADVAAFGIAYLNGVENPVVEDAPLPSHILGQAWRGYIDFGVCQVDAKGAVKSTGAG